MEFEYYRPLTAGDRCKVIRAQVGVADKPSRFGGRTAHVTHDFLYALLFFATAAAFAFTACHGRFGRSTSGLSRSWMRS